jgi:hypothetical protein
MARRRNEITMRTTVHLVISISVALILGLLFTEMRTSAVMVEAHELGLLAVEKDSSMPLSPTPQNASFIWVEKTDIGDYPGYMLVEGGKHNDGTMMYLCRIGGTTPGKLYKNLCHYPYGGGETIVGTKFQVLMTNVAYRWLAVHDLSPAQIKSEAVKGGVDEGSRKTPPLYLCRKKMNDGVHPGKYSYSKGLCYIPWGNREHFYSDGFEILFP